MNEYTYQKISKLNKNVTDNADVVLYFGNEINSAANDFKATRILNTKNLFISYQTSHNRRGIQSMSNFNFHSSKTPGPGHFIF